MEEGEYYGISWFDIDGELFLLEVFECEFHGAGREMGGVVEMGKCELSEKGGGRQRLRKGDVGRRSA